MSKRIFSSEQVNEMLKNENILRCSEKSITYHKDFKIRAVKQYQSDGLSAVQIFKDAGFNVDIIGRETPKNCLGDWCKIFKVKGIDGLSKEQRGGPGRRHSVKNLTDKERIQELENRVAYLKAENDFLAKIRAGKRK